MAESSSTPAMDPTSKRHTKKQANPSIRGLSSRFSLRGRNTNLTSSTDHNACNPADKYKDYPLMQSMLRENGTRRKILDEYGAKQRNYTKSNDGWIKTMMTIEGRALDNIALPWALCTANATAYTVAAELGRIQTSQEATDSWEFFFGIVLNTSLSFLLVFRLNRAAERYWLARENWGTIVGTGRYLAGGIIVHGSHHPAARDKGLRWICGFAVATMQFMRSTEHIPPQALAGILTEADILKMQYSEHSPIYAAYQIRDALKEMFRVTAETPLSLACAWTQQLSMLEEALNRIMDQEGAMERIRSSPLPLVYVAHLRTFVLLFLLALPYIWQASWGWATIPVVAVTSFALLGLDGASSECEAPFRRDRTNHLNMSAFCLLLLNNVQQSLQHSVDQELENKKSLEGSTTAAAAVDPVNGAKPKPSVANT
jgi:ion channel-forming bestrophin family protein